MYSGVVSMDDKKVISYSDLLPLLNKKGIALNEKFSEKHKMIVEAKLTPVQRDEYRGDIHIPFLYANEKLNPSNEIGLRNRTQLTNQSAEHIRHIKEVTDNPAEWLSELVQNALDLHDLTEMGLSIDNEKGNLVWWHNGKDNHGKSFSSSNKEEEIDDLTALLQLGSSNKSNDLQSEGRFGLGFKYWPKWWESTTLLVEEIKLKWKLEEGGRFFEMDEDKLGARYLEQYPERFADKTFFVFEGKTEAYEHVQWNHLQHVLWGLSTRNFSINFTVQIDGESNTFTHGVKNESSPLEYMKVCAFENTFSGEGETLLFPKRGEIVTMKLRDLPRIQHQHIDAKVDEKVSTLKATMTEEQKMQLDLKKSNYLSVKNISLVYITDDEVPEHACLTSLFPISGSQHHGSTREHCYINKSRYIFDAPFEITRNRRYLQLKTDSYHSALFSGFQMMAEMLIRRDFEAQKPIRNRIEAIEKCFAEHNPIRPDKTHSFFIGAKIWPTKNANLRSFSDGVKALRSTVTTFWNSSIQDLPEDVKTEAYQTLKSFVHRDEAILPDGPINSWLLERSPYQESGFVGDFEEVKALSANDLILRAGFGSLSNEWQPWLPIPIESLQNGAEWLNRNDLRLHFIENPVDLETSQDAAKELLGNLLQLEGDIITYLNPKFKNVILSLVEFQKNSLRPGFRMVNDIEFIELDAENPAVFYGSLLSAAFRGKKVIQNDEEEEFLIPKNTFLAHLENFPQQKGYWPVFGIIIDSEGEKQEMVMFEEPHNIRENIHIAFTHRAREDEEWPTLWSVDTKNDNWSGNGFLPQNKDKGKETEFPSFATRRTTSSDLDLVYFSHWPQALQNLCERLMKNYTAKCKIWNYNFNTESTIRPRPHIGGKISFERVQLVTQTQAMMDWIDNDKTMLIPGFLVPYQLKPDDCRKELSENLIGGIGENIYSDHKKGILTQYDKDKNHWLQCIHNRLHKSSYPDVDTDFNTPDTVITRTMSLSMLLLDTVLTGNSAANNGYDLSQALMLCAANLDIQRGSFSMHESWMRDMVKDRKQQSSKGRSIKIQKIREGENETGEARLRTDSAFADLSIASPLGFKTYLGAEKTQVDILNGLYYSNINSEDGVWAPCPPDYEPTISIRSSEFNLIELVPLTTLMEDESQLVERFKSTIKWLFSTPKLLRKVDKFAKLWLTNLRSKPHTNILNGLEYLCRLWQASGKHNHEERFAEWFKRNTTPFSIESKSVLKDLAQGGYWSTQRHLEILQQMLEFAGSSGQVLLSFDQALIQKRDLGKAKFSDYYHVADSGILETHTQNPIQIEDSSDEILFVCVRELEQIIGEKIQPDKTLQLENRFQFEYGTKIFHYESIRENRIPEQYRDSIVDFEEVIGLQGAYEKAVEEYYDTSTINDKHSDIEPKFEFLQKWIRVVCLSKIAEKDSENIDVNRFLASLV